MSNKNSRERAAEDKREGKSPSTQAGEFVRRRRVVEMKRGPGARTVRGWLHNT
jgi:hypothetical protein